MSNEVLASINKLYNKEKNSISNIDGNILEHSGDVHHKYASLSAYAKKCFSCSAEPFSLGKIKCWGGSLPRIRIPEAMFLQPSTIVDILPESEDDFIKRTGVTVNQFCTLADEGFVIPNLAYDSEIENCFGEQLDISQSNYVKYPYLARILDPDRTPSMIHGIRRGKVFDGMGFNQEWRGSRISQFHGITQKLVEDYNIDDLNNIRQGMVALTQSDISKMLSRNMMYVEAFENYFGCQDASRLLYAFVKKPSIDIILNIISHVQARKDYLCGQITACFGGVQSLSEDQYARALSHSPAPYRDAPERIESERKLFAEYLVFLSEMKRKSDLYLSPSLTYPLPDSAFNSLLEFCKNTYEDRSVVEVLYENSKMLISNEAKIDSLRSYFDLYISLVNASQDSPTLIKYITGAGIGGSLAYAASMAGEGQPAQHYVEGTLGAGMSRRRFLVSLIGAAGGACTDIPDFAMETCKKIETLFEDPALQAARRVVVRNTNALIGKFEMLAGR